MTSLRARITILLILAIVSVVGLATYAATRALQPPPPEATMEPLARQLHVLATLAQTDRAAAIAAGIVLQSAPASGVEEAGMTRFLSRAFEKTGVARTATVTRMYDSPILTASVDLGTGEWLVLDVPDFRPPPGVWWALAGWVVLITIGATAVSLFAASKITKPLEMLESAAGQIGTDGVLPRIPETGSAEVRATAQALNRLSTRLKFAMESRMRLVAAAGHDLRTPMTRMRLRAEFVSDEEEREKWLADLEELDAIADSAIRLVREEVEDDGQARVQLGSLMHEIVDELAQLGYKVTPPPLVSLVVAGGLIALKRALRNLVVNAATHGAGARIELTQEGQMAVVKIHDQGPGIPEEMIDRVFEPFFRVDVARRKTMPGAGLGLAIAKETIERFGGTIKIANSNAPRGLIQTIRLPLAQQAVNVN